MSDYVERANLYARLLQTCLEYFAGTAFRSEVHQAKMEFFENAGVLDENDPQYDLRMSQFFDWYFFTRELSGYNQTPLDAMMTVRELRLDHQELKLLEDFKRVRHSLFEFVKFRGSDMVIKDLLANEKITIRNCPYTTGFNSSEIFEARLIPADEDWIFTKGFCFHPSDARKFILSEVKRHRKDPDLNPDLLMLELVKMRYRSERYRHVKVSRIYSRDAGV